MLHGTIPWLSRWLLALISSTEVVMGVCPHRDQDGTAVPSWSCLKAVYKPVWHIPLLSVQWINSWWWTDELSETCRVSWQNKFVKLVHLVGFYYKKICYDAQLHERKIPPLSSPQSSHYTKYAILTCTYLSEFWIIPIMCVVCMGYSKVHQHILTRTILVPSAYVHMNHTEQVNSVPTELHNKWSVLKYINSSVIIL
jgi:hypothetical protein